MTATWEEKVAFFEGLKDGVLSDAVNTRVLPSLTLAQAALESGWGTSDLSSLYHNYFGIKAGEGQAAVCLPTTEYQHGVAIRENAYFRIYDDVEAGIADHTALFRRVMLDDNNLRYQRVLDAKDYKEACTAVMECGYATDPAYSLLLIHIIEENGLAGYDDQYNAIVNPVKAENEEAVKAVIDWVEHGLKWLQNPDNVNPPISSEWKAEEYVSFAVLGEILSRLVGK